MKVRSNKPTREELIAQLKTRGWDLVAGKPTFSVKDRTLEELVRTTHARHKKGEALGLISRMETALELDLIQIQELWEHLGLPI
jgi:hypothetical protein